MLPSARSNGLANLANAVLRSDDYDAVIFDHSMDDFLAGNFVPKAIFYILPIRIKPIVLEMHGVMPWFVDKLKNYSALIVQEDADLSDPLRANLYRDFEEALQVWMQMIQSSCPEFRRHTETLKNRYQDAERISAEQMAYLESIERSIRSRLS